ncbi:MAG: hypothetical protein KIT29_02185 [Anaerolineales bacterium]|nr:hypothetical protein [Anaerolineales bacterium]MCW5838701.1 hypothetical protein [Anaerolineales bacterium]
MSEKAILIICLTVLGAGGLLLVIYAGARRRGALGEQIDMARRMLKNSKNPWKHEDEQVEELAKKVEALTKPK